MRSKVRFIILISLVVVTLGSFVSTNAQEDRYVKIERIELDGHKLEFNEFLVTLYADPKSRGIRAKTDGTGFFVPVELTGKDIGVVLFLKPQLLRLGFHQVSARFLDSPWKIGIDTEPFASEYLGDKDPSKVDIIYYLLPVALPRNRIVVTEMKPNSQVKHPYQP